MDSQPNDGELLAITDPSPYALLPALQMTRVRAIQESCLQAMAHALSTYLDSPITAALASVESLADGFNATEEGACRLTLDMEPVRGQAFVTLGPGLMSQLLRLLLGAPDRTGLRITDIELHILRETFDVLVRELAAAWESPDVRLRWTATNTAQPEEGALLVFDCRLLFGEVEESLRFVIPPLVARLALMRTADAPPLQNQAAARSILQALRTARVQVEAVLTGTSLRMSDLLSLQPGQVLLLGEAAGSPLSAVSMKSPNSAANGSARVTRRRCRFSKRIQPADQQRAAQTATVPAPQTRCPRRCTHSSTTGSCSRNMSSLRRMRSATAFRR